ncbi:MAG: polysaccharide deacetylase family protein [Deltaproteobacteria bacterium]|nr:polysaccharide deacetylase family protein [Deltaproteobacteria bacterium]
MKIPILMYHMVRETDDPKEKRYCCHPDAFKQQMAYLKRAGYQVIGLDDLTNSIKNGTTLPQKSIAITFDDGFDDNYENAFPVLKKYGFPATVFVVSRLVGRTNEWMQEEGFPVRKLLGWEELKDMSENGITISSHTTTHASLTDMDTESARHEISNSKSELENALGRAVYFFAYPYGRFNEQVEKLVVEAGYLGACSTRSGFNSEHANPFALRRLEIYGTDTLWNFMWKLKFGTNEATLALPLKYYYSRILDRLAPFAPKQ